MSVSAPAKPPSKKLSPLMFQVMETLRENPDDPFVLVEFERINKLIKEFDSASRSLDEAKAEVKELQESLHVSELTKKKKELQSDITAAIRGLVKPMPLFDADEQK